MTGSAARRSSDDALLNLVIHFANPGSQVVY